MKKIAIKLLTALLIVSTAVSTASAKKYPDVQKSHWAYKQIQALSNEYVIVGYPSGTFRPDAPATRAEFATMVIKALRQENAPLTQTISFSDVPYSHWAYNTIQRAVAFDLIKGSSDGTFRPEDNITKAEAVAIIVSAIKTGNLSVEKAKDVLTVYADYAKLPDWAIVPAGKSEIIGLTAHAPESGKNFDADKKISRAETAVSLYNMQIEAKLNPNDKLADAMRAKKGEGAVIKGVKVDGTIATILKGTKLPMLLMTAMDSQTSESGEVFIVKTDQNLVTKDKYLLIAKGSNVDGEVMAVKQGKLFVRNGKLVLETKDINTPRGQTTTFVGKVDPNIHKCFFARIFRFIFKGDKIKLAEGKLIYVKLVKPIKIDLTNGWIIKDKSN